MIKRTINKILKSINNLPAQYKVALARILTGMIESIDYINKKIENLGGGDWNENDNTKSGYIKNRTHYKDTVSPIVSYIIDNERFEGSINDVLNYLDNNVIPLQAIFDSPHYNVVMQENSVTDRFQVGFANIDNNNYIFAIYYGDAHIIEYTIQSITNVKCKQNFLNLVSLVCDNVNNVYKFKETINFNNVDEFKNYYFHIEDEGIIYNKIDRHYLPDNVHGDWNQNNSNELNYIENRTHYRESVLPVPIVEYSIQGEMVEGTIEDVLNYLDNNTDIYTIEINCGKYKYIKNNNEIINNLKINYSTDVETSEGQFNVSLYDNYIFIEDLIVFRNISGVNQEKKYFLNIINLFCDNIDDVYRLKKSITINNVNYVLDESELEYVYHKLDKNYLPYADNIIKITYSELKSLRNNSQLTPGIQYRITDYQCTTTQSNTRSAGNQFDIIVIADDVNKLNENARACLHEGDTYFSTAGSKLEAWKLKYSLDNDINKFKWADSVNGKGVIYWMKDERDNECFYDFKNIQFKIGAKTQPGTIADVFYYTFSVAIGVNDATVTDHSLNRTCYNNKIGVLVPLDYNLRQELSFNVFRNTETSAYCFSNIFGGNCSNNTFGSYCYSNTFEYNCRDNVFGNGYRFSIFGNACYYNTFENECCANIFGTGCCYNRFTNNCYHNFFGNNCQHIIFTKNYVHNVIIENGNQYITITSTNTTSSSSLLRNIIIVQGVNNNTTIGKTISHNTVNDTFQTIYKAIGSTEIEV